MNQHNPKIELQCRRNPPKVSLAFRVGVVGHRLNRLTKASPTQLATTIGEILGVVKETVFDCYQAERELFDDTKPKLVALSALAEGTDRIFADAALTENYTLTAVLPFPQDDYVNDFSPQNGGEPNSEVRFRSLLGQAQTVFALDGSRTDDAFAYGTAGTVILNQSDLLIIVWDGRRQHLRGGTEEILDEAVSRRAPVVWIDADDPHRWILLQEPLPKLRPHRPDERVEMPPSGSKNDLVSLVKRLVELPKPSSDSESAHDHGDELREEPLKWLRIYYSERQPTYNLSIWWKLFRDFVGDFKFKKPAWRVLPYEPSTTEPDSTQNSPNTNSIGKRIQPYYHWADKLAERYADGYRSIFVVSYFLAAFSVAMALGAIGIGIDPHSRVAVVFSFLELAAILTILLSVFWGRHFQWHRRWLNYRLLAEIIRHEQLVIFLGGLRASPSIPDHLDSYGNPGASWMAWYARNVERSLGLPSTVLDRNYLLECNRGLHEQVSGANGQVGFHENTARRSSTIEHRLHRTEVILFGITLILCAVHFWHSLSHVGATHHEGHENQLQVSSGAQILTFFCGFLPAMGAALAGINHQGEFRRIAHRSHSMSKRLKQQSEKIKSIQKKLEDTRFVNVQLSPEVANVATETARIMIDEVLDWRVIFQDQPLKTT